MTTPVSNAPRKSSWPTEPTGDIPARFLWLADGLLTGLSMLFAYLATPTLLRGLLPGSVLSTILAAFPIPESEGGELRPLTQMLQTLVVIVPSTLWAMELLGGYRDLMRQSRSRVVISSLGAPAVGLGAFALVAFALRIERLSRMLFLAFGVFDAALLLSYRLAIRSYKKRRFEAGYYSRNVLIIGEREDVRRMVQDFAENVSRKAFRIVGCLSVPQASPANGDYEVPVIGAVSDLGRLLIHQPINDVIAIQGPGSDWLRGVIDQCDYFSVSLRILPAAILGRQLQDLRAPNFGDGLRLPATVLQPIHYNTDAMFVKRIIDLVVSAALLILLLPVFVVIVIAIRAMTPGVPVLYRWRVVGQKGHQFVGYKFSTMREGADAEKEQLLHLNEMSGPVFKIKNDPRVTPLGRFLRKYSLNELPQLWSVLKGDMSLVGPRPAFPHELARYEDWQKRKLSVRPGITCLWQVSGRNRINNFDDWVRLDLEYIDNWSLWLDAKILLRTVWAVLAGTGS